MFILPYSMNKTLFTFFWIGRHESFGFSHTVRRFAKDGATYKFVYLEMIKKLPEVFPVDPRGTVVKVDVLKPNVVFGKPKDGH